MAQHAIRYGDPCVSKAYGQPCLENAIIFQPTNFLISTASTVMQDSAASSTPQIVVTTANIVFVAGAVFSLSIAAYGGYRMFAPIFAVYSGGEDWANDVRTFYSVAIVIGILFAIVFGLGLRLKDNTKVNLSLLIIATGITVYSVETYLEVSIIIPDRSIVDTELTTMPGATVNPVTRINFDKRTKLEVLEDLKEKGIEAYPIIGTDYLLWPTTSWRQSPTKHGLETKTGKIFPISGIANRVTIGSNENGYWMSYVSDKYGFHNSNDVYETDPVDIVLTGDSFTQGFSVRSNENVSAVLRTFGLNVVNLGKGGNGPLAEYAALKEYAELLEPRVVVWLYFQNDMSNLSGEIQSDLLRRYLNEDEFSQNLILRQEEIDSVLIDWVEQVLPQRSKQFVEYHKESLRVHQEALGRETRLKDLEKEAQLEIEHRKQFNSKPLIKILKLRNLREIIHLAPDRFIAKTPNSSPRPNPNSSDVQLAFTQTLEKVIRLVSNWNSKWYFVYLPGGKYIDEEHPWREFVLRTVTDLGVPIIDAQNEVFATHTDPLSLFPLRNSGNHYNAKGYRLIAEAIAKRLKADGVLQ
jgi:hypothetical protein